MSFTPINTDQIHQLRQQLIDAGTIVDPGSAKGRLLKSAATLFRTKGFERTTVRDLAKEVGIQSGSLFHHYPSKQEILRSVVEETILLNIALMKLSLSLNHSVQNKLYALILCELQSILVDTGAEMAVLVYEWRGLNEENQAQILTLRDEYERLWLDVLKQAYEEQMISIKPTLLRRLLIGAISWSINWYKPDGDLSLEELAGTTLSLALEKSGAVPSTADVGTALEA
ncbi:TetR/AcrR family transcriptional regulator [Endozoicomonas montiporae]|uniref:Putative TetR family transcriptional regulator n=1 Tax=Endozoicomonas montiporae CL-33 TaxID=570277 RepID=A0A142BGQ3_9GAMM|nr:TetR/AcrR family transcriptional regulator [Endozoicomonas montiporae]AMO57929.1 putative TetR family transcriptional regulator [Endozoicomonas montiporae CL-33]